MVDHLISTDKISKQFYLNNHDRFVKALNAVSLSVGKGECVGLIGKNGSGKSTLLKLLSGITKPTEGQIRIKGKLLSVLELGHGVIPELTGIENIFTMGSLQGYTKSEMQSKVESIVNLADLGQFINYPLKTYSNGMYLKLAFATMAFLDADVLLIDEVIGTGDAKFREKTLDVLQAFRNKGCAIVLASHNPDDLVKIANRLVWLEQGSVKMDGEYSKVLNEYLLFSQEGKVSGNSLPELKFPLSLTQGVSTVDVLKVSARAKGRAANEPITTNDTIEIYVAYRKKSTAHKCEVAMHIHTLQGVHVLVDCQTFRLKNFEYTMADGEYTAICEIPADFLNTGFYSVSLTFVHDGNEDVLFFKKVCFFGITPPDLSQLTEPQKQILGNYNLNNAITKPHLKWRLQNAQGSTVYAY